MKKHIRKTAVFLVTAVTAGTLCACRAQTEQAESPEITPEETEETMAVLPGGWEMIKDTSVDANIDVSAHRFGPFRAHPKGPICDQLKGPIHQCS